MPEQVAPVEWVALLARLARTLRRCLAVLAASAVMPGSLVVARRARVVPTEQSHRATAAMAERAAPAERAAIAEPAALAAVAVPGRAAAVVWDWRASAALVAVAARAAPAGMRAASPTAQLVVMLGLVALAARVALLARLARTLRLCWAGPAVSGVTPGPLVVALRV